MNVTLLVDKSSITNLTFQGTCAGRLAFEQAISDYIHVLDHKKWKTFIWTFQISSFPHFRLANIRFVQSCIFAPSLRWSPTWSKSQCTFVSRLWIILTPNNVSQTCHNTTATTLTHATTPPTFSTTTTTTNTEFGCICFACLLDWLCKVTQEFMCVKKRIDCPV